jgi:hypothetical protein
MKRKDIEPNENMQSSLLCTELGPRINKSSWRKE